MKKSYEQVIDLVTTIIYFSLVPMAFFLALLLFLFNSYRWVIEIFHYYDFISSLGIMLFTILYIAEVVSPKDIKASIEIRKACVLSAMGLTLPNHTLYFFLLTKVNSPGILELFLNIGYDRTEMRILALLTVALFLYTFLIRKIHQSSISEIKKEVYKEFLPWFLGSTVVANMFWFIGSGTYLYPHSLYFIGFMAYFICITLLVDFEKGFFKLLLVILLLGYLFHLVYQYYYVGPFLFTNLTHFVMLLGLPSYCVFLYTVPELLTTLENRDSKINLKTRKRLANLTFHLCFLLSGSYYVFPQLLPSFKFLNFGVVLPPLISGGIALIQSRRP